MWQQKTPNNGGRQQYLVIPGKSLSFDGGYISSNSSPSEIANIVKSPGSGLSSSMSALPPPPPQRSKVLSTPPSSVSALPMHLQRSMDKNRRRGVTVATSSDETQSRRRILLGNTRPYRKRSKSLEVLNSWDFTPFDMTKRDVNGQLVVDDYINDSKEEDEELRVDRASFSSTSSQSSPRLSLSGPDSSSSPTILSPREIDSSIGQPHSAAAAPSSPSNSPRVQQQLSSSQEIENGNGSIRLSQTVNSLSSSSISKLSYETNENKKFVVVSGPKDQLVEYLCNKNKLDIPFVNSFILTFKYFISPEELLDFLIQKYDTKIPSTTSIKITKQFEEIVERIKQNVITILTTWIDSNFNDFQDDQKLYQKLLSFINEQNSKPLKDAIDRQKIFNVNLYEITELMRIEISTNAPLTPRIGNHKSDKSANFINGQIIVESIMKQLDIGYTTAVELIFNRLLKIKVIGSVGGFVNIKNKNPKDELFFFVNNNTTPSKEAYSRSFLEYHPQDIAKQLTLLEFKIFQSIKLNELYQKSWTNPKTKFQNSPNIMALIAMSNRVANWVATEVVTTPHPKKRVEVLKRFILVAEYCKKINNFNTLMEIVSGLNNCAVSRLKETWKALPTRYSNLLHQLQDFLKTDENWKSYRQALRSKEVPCLPYLGLFLQDTNFVEDGNSSTVMEGQDTHVNFKKMTLLSNIFSEIQYFQKHPYFSFTSHSHIQTYLQSDMVIIPEKELFAFSKFIENPTNPLNKLSNEIDDSTIITNITLPIIDISALFKEDDVKGKEEVSLKIRDACLDHGFFYITGHGVSSELISQLDQLSRIFFSMDENAKMNIEMAKGGSAWRGYFKLGGELTSNLKDWKEGIYFGSELPKDHPLSISTPIHGENLFPDAEIEDMRPTVLKYIEVMTELGHKLMEGIALSLGLEADYFYSRYTKDPLVLFRIFNYPSTPVPEGMPVKYGVGAHTDYGILTILSQDDIGGLEVKTKQGWISAVPIPGTYICNIGDMLDKMTGGLYKSTLHRVRLNTTGRDRLSFPFFFDPNFFVQVQPITGVNKDLDDSKERWDHSNLHAFEGTYGDYLLKKVGQVFPDLKNNVL
eukprot:gene3684-4589_t